MEEEVNNQPPLHGSLKCCLQRILMNGAGGISYYIVPRSGAKESYNLTLYEPIG